MTTKAISLMVLAVLLHLAWAVSLRRPNGALLRTKRRVLLRAFHAGCPHQTLRWMPL